MGARALWRPVLPDPQGRLAGAARDEPGHDAERRSHRPRAVEARDEPRPDDHRDRRRRGALEPRLPRARRGEPRPQTEAPVALDRRRADEARPAVEPYPALPGRDGPSAEEDPPAAA